MKAFMFEIIFIRIFDESVSGTGSLAVIRTITHFCFIELIHFQDNTPGYVFPIINIVFYPAFISL